MEALVRICWAGTALAAIGALVQYVSAMGDATSAPQQAAGAAMAVATVVIPYIFTRGVEGLAGRGSATVTEAKDPPKKLAAGEGQY